MTSSLDRHLAGRCSLTCGHVSKFSKKLELQEEVFLVTRVVWKATFYVGDRLPTLRKVFVPSSLWTASPQKINIGRSFWMTAYTSPTTPGHISVDLTLILPRSRTGTVWFYTSTSNKRAALPKLYTKSLTRDLNRMYSRFTLVRISINL